MTHMKLQLKKAEMNMHVPMQTSLLRTAMWVASRNSSHLASPVKAPKVDRLMIKFSSLHTGCNLKQQAG